MSRIELLYLRHAEAEHVLDPDTIAGHAPGSKLTEAGIDQTEALGTWLGQNFAPDIVDSSPLERCTVTMRRALRVSGIIRGINIRPELIEKCNGEHESLPKAAIYTPAVVQDMRDQGADWRSPGFNAEGSPGESLNGALGRMLRNLVSYGASIAEEPLRVAAMAHSVSLRTLLSGLELGALEAPPDPLELHRHFMALHHPIDPCSRTLVILEPAGSARLGFRHRLEYVGATDTTVE